MLPNSVSVMGYAINAIQCNYFHEDLCLNMFKGKLDNDLRTIGEFKYVLTFSPAKRLV